MSKQAVNVVRLTLFKHSHASFLAALDDASIVHHRVHLFSSGIQASGIVETISALSDAMPWNALAKVIVAWIDARKSREVLIQTDDGVFHARGYSAKDIHKLLPQSSNVTIIDTKPNDESTEENSPS